MYLLTVELDRVGVAHLSQNILSVTLSYKPFLRILTSISYYLKKKKKKKACFLAAEAPRQMLCNTSLYLFVRKT